MYNVFVITDGTTYKLHEADPSSSIKAMGSIKSSINAIDSFSFKILPDNPSVGHIKPLQSMVNVYKATNGQRVFRGRVLMPTSSMDNSGNINTAYVCESELAYLNDTIQPYQQADSIREFFTDVLNTHNSQVPASKRIYLGTVILNGKSIQSRTWYYISSWQAISDFVREYGGEFRLRYSGDNRYLDYTTTYFTSGSSTKIELAVNMQSISFTVDPTKLYTGVYPVGVQLVKDGTSAQRLELGEIVWNSELRAKYGDIVGCVEWDDVTQVDHLRTKAAEWLENQQGELHQYKVTAVDLSKINANYDEFQVGTQYAISNPLIGLNDTVRCISKTIDLNELTKTTLSFGDKYETFTSIEASRNRIVTQQIQRASDNITKNQSEYAQQIVEQQTALLTGAEGGYVYQRLNEHGKPQETFFLDAPSIETATKALRFNYMGMGFWDKSKTGQSDKTPLTGQYQDAWTIDGTFHTEYICGKQITGFTFDNGDGTFKVEASGKVTATDLTITNGSINCGNGKFVVTSAGAVTAEDLTITNGSINCGNGTFTVTSAGAVTANSLSSNNATITGGSINIQTASQTQDKIALTYGDWTIKLSPLQLKLSNSSTGEEMLLQAGALFAKASSTGNKQAQVTNSGLVITNNLGATIASLTENGLAAPGNANISGDITASGTHKVYGCDIMLKMHDYDSGYVSLRDYINAHS